MGNLPTKNSELMKLIQKAVDNNVIVVIKTQCYKGSVEDVYATGRMLTSMGCILGMDMTVECLFAKLSYLFGKVSKVNDKFWIEILHRKNKVNDDEKSERRVNRHAQ